MEGPVAPAVGSSCIASSPFLDETARYFVIYVAQQFQMRPVMNLNVHLLYFHR